MFVPGSKKPASHSVTAPGAGPGDAQPKSLDALAQVCQAVAGDLELGAVMRSAMRAAQNAMNAEACTLFRRDADTQSLLFHIVDGPRSERLSSASLPIDDRSIAGWVAKHQAPLLIPDAYRDSRFNPSYDAKTGFRTRSVICAPLLAKGRLLGVIQVLNRRDGRSFNETDLELAQDVASLVAVAIHNAEEHQARINAERLATIGQMMAGMAHCVKNILNGLQAGSYILEQNLGGASAGASRGWEMVKRNLGLLSNIVLDMLSYSRPRKPLLQPCPIGDLCQSIVLLLQSQAAQKNVTLVTSSNLAEAWVDESGIQRCLINLVGNAIDACGTSGGLVQIEAGPSAAAGCFEIRVRDNGCGMDAPAREKLFAPFFSTKGNKGTGLGLAVTKKIVEEHGGTLRVESAPGAGTEFALILPAAPPANGVNQGMDSVRGTTPADANDKEREHR
jgi:signal transduction histidine kinase